MNTPNQVTTAAAVPPDCSAAVAANPQDWLGLPDALREVGRLTGTRGAISYPQACRAAAAGYFPVEKVKGQYRIHKDTLPEMAAAFGLTVAREPVAA